MLHAPPRRRPRRPSPGLALAAAPLVALGGCGGAFSNSYRPPAELHTARHTLTLDRAPLQPLDVETASGAVEVARAEVGPGVTIDADITSATLERAQSAQITAETDAGVTRVRIAWPGGEREPHDAASITVRASALGDIRAATGFGAVTLSGFDAAADAATSNGPITAEGMGGPLQLQTGFGAINVARSPVDVLAESSNGPITIDDAASVRADTGFGAVEITDAAGPAVATTSNGAVTIRGATRAEARSNFGAIQIDAVPGEVIAETANGRVNVRGGSNVHVKTGFGAVEIVGAAGPVRAESSNGAVSVRLTPESPGPVHAASGFGHVSLWLGPGFRGALTAEAPTRSIDFGPFDDAWAVSGVSTADKSLRATFHGAQPESRAATRNGRVSIKPLRN